MMGFPQGLVGIFFAGPHCAKTSALGPLDEFSAEPKKFHQKPCSNMPLQFNTKQKQKRHCQQLLEVLIDMEWTFNKSEL